MAGFKPIIPDVDKIFDLELFVFESLNALNKISDNVKTDFESVTATWKGKPRFQGRKATQSKPVATMWANSDTWVWGNRGTKPHIIAPRGGGVLAFKPGYNRKSSRSSLSSSRGGSFGKTVYTRRPVRHPGTDGGFWDKQSAIKQQPALTQMMKDAVKKAA